MLDVLTEAVESVPGRLWEHPSQHGRPGRRFQPVAEENLRVHLRSAALTLPSSHKGALVIPEFRGPVGMPDLGVLTGGSAGLEERMLSGIPPLLTVRHARLVANLAPRAGRTAAEVAHRAHVDDVQRVASTLRELATLGAVEAVGKSFRRHPALTTFGRIWAIEAKVDDWAKAISQAVRYGSWADGVAVVMARLPRDPAPAVAYADRMSVGLALEDRWLVKPRLHSVDPVQRFWASEHCVAALTAPAAAVPA